MFYWLVWSYLMCIRLLKVNCIPLMKCTFLACFDDMSAHGLILSTSGVLTAFLYFPQILGSGRWKAFGDDFGEDLEFLIIQVG